MTIDRLRHALTIGAMLFSVGTSGCVYREVAHPRAPAGQAIQVQFTSDSLSSFSEVPMGTYRIPKSQVLISGFQYANALMVAAVPAVGISMAMDTKGGRAAVRSYEDALQLTLVAEAREDIKTLLTESAFEDKFTETPGPTAPVLSISGDIVLEFFDDSPPRPFVVLKAQLFNPGSLSPAWGMRYAASVGRSRPFTGDGSWMADNAAAMKAALSASLERSLKVLLTDVATPFPRDDSHKVAVNGYFPFLKKRVQVVGFALSEDADSIVFLPVLPETSTLAGVQIMDKAVSTSRPATRADSRISVARDR
jgi:hypothetical protein